MSKPIQAKYDLDPRVATANAILGVGADQSPTYSPAVGWGRLLAGALGGYKSGKLRREYEGQDQALQQAYADALMSGDRNKAIEILGREDPQAGLTLRASQWDAEDAAAKYKAQQEAELQQKIAEATNPQIQAAKLAVAEAMGGLKTADKYSTMIPPTVVGPDGSPVLATLPGNPLSGQKVPPPASSQKGPTALPNAAIDKLAAAGAQAEKVGSLESAFKPEYGGHTILGGLSNTFGKLAGDPSGQTQWWQTYQETKNKIRHELFGSALTNTERDEFDKANINERMESGEIQKNLKRQAEAAKKAAAKLAEVYKTGGYNKEQVDLLVSPETAPPVTPPSAPSSPRRIKYSDLQP